LYRNPASLGLKSGKFITAQGKPNQGLSKLTYRASVPRENYSRIRTPSDQVGDGQVYLYRSCCSCTRWWAWVAHGNGAVTGGRAKHLEEDMILTPPLHLQPILLVYQQPYVLREDYPSIPRQ